MDKQKVWAISQVVWSLATVILIIAIVLVSKPQKVSTIGVLERTQVAIDEAVKVISSSCDIGIDDKWYIRDDIPMEIENQRLLMKACQQTYCPYDLALAVCYVETGMRNIVGDNGNSIGFIQIQPRWVRDRMERLGVTDLKDAYSNFLVGTSILSEYVNEYGTVDGLTKYNSGHTGQSEYAKKVIRVRERLANEENFMEK